MATNQPDVHSRSPLRFLRRGSPEIDLERVYRYYQEVRDKLIEWSKTSGEILSPPSQYWVEELSNFDYMMDASPLIIRKLRHHCFHVTGLRVYDYRTNKTRGKAPLLEKLHSLQAFDPQGDLLVPESRALGGFGFDFDGELFNVDTLKYYEVLLGLEASGLLRDFRIKLKRKLVWEIGAGWGGFPYQFKTIFPNVTYVIVDLPELFVFSAVYLRAMFPKARLRVCTDIPPAEVFSGWREYDFIFIPNTMTSNITFPRLDLMINMVSFQEMTEEQVDAYVKKAADSQCWNIYSLNMWKPKYNSELSDLNPILSRYYNTQRVRLLRVGYNVLNVPEKTVSSSNGESQSVTGKPPAATSGKQPKDGNRGLYDSGYVHVKGGLRVTAPSAQTDPSTEVAVSKAN